MEKHFSYQLESQFPAIYRESGRELIGLVEAYYTFLETVEGQPIHGLRHMPVYKDVDSTLSNMLIFYKNKYLSGLPFDGEGVRVAVKNILDLYQRKGSEEGITLFFKMFFDVSVRVYYPSTDILRVSDSKWRVDAYIELFPHSKVHDGIVGGEIVGSMSRARAIVDYVTITSQNSNETPVLFVNDIRGEFLANERVFWGDKLVGKIRGSLTSVTIVGNGIASYGNKLGDEVEIVSSTGDIAIASVSKVSTTPNGSLPISVVDGGYGYTTLWSRISVTKQSVYLANMPSGIEDGYILEQGDITAEVKGGMDYGYINVEYTRDTSTFETGPAFLNGEEVEIIFATPYNDSAYASVGELSDVETVGIITDKLASFLDVPLASPNYSDPPALEPMSAAYPDGMPYINNETIIDDAFVKTIVDIGTIKGMSNINEGYNYNTVPSIFATDDIIRELDIKEQYFSLASSNQFIPHGTLVTQTNGAKGVVYGNDGIYYKISPRSFTRFVADLPLVVGSSEMNIERMLTNHNSRILGDNSLFDGIPTYDVGLIQEVKILSSGFSFGEGQSVTIRNRAKDGDKITAFGIAHIGGNGITKGYWENNNSQLNSDKRLQDSDYYQEYSYEIITNISPEVYDTTFMSHIHGAGVKKFHKYEFGETLSISTDIKLETNIDK